MRPTPPAEGGARGERPDQQPGAEEGSHAPSYRPRGRSETALKPRHRGTGRSLEFLGRRAS